MLIIHISRSLQKPHSKWRFHFSILDNFDVWAISNSIYTSCAVDKKSKDDNEDVEDNNDDDDDEDDDDYQMHNNRNYSIDR